MNKNKIFYVVKTVGKQYKTGCTQDLTKRMREFRVTAPQAVVADQWPCPGGVMQEHKAQQKMRNHPCCKWIGGENFEVYDERTFTAELRTLFGEPAPIQLTHAEKFFGVMLPRYNT